MNHIHVHTIRTWNEKEKERRDKKREENRWKKVTKKTKKETHTLVQNMARQFFWFGFDPEPNQYQYWRPNQWYFVVSMDDDWKSTKFSKMKIISVDQMDDPTKWWWWSHKKCVCVNHLIVESIKHKSTSNCLHWRW